MVGRHYQLNGHEFEKTPGNGEGQGGLACCSPWGHKESDMTGQLNKTDEKQRNTSMVLPMWLSGNVSALQCRTQGLDPWVRKIPLEEGVATHSSILAWRIPWTEDPGGATVHGVAKSITT